MSLRKPGLIGLAFALVAFGGCIAFLAKHAGDADTERQYTAAQPCRSARLAGPDCFQVVTATVASKTGDLNNYNLNLNVPGLGHTSEGLAAGDRAAIYARLTVGAPVSVKVWQREVTLVLVGSLRADTFQNPTYAPGDDLRAAVIFAIAGGLLAAQGFLSLRAKPQREGYVAPDPELDRLSGPFGMDSGASVAVTREYRGALGTARTAALAVTMLGSSTAAAVRIDASVPSLLIGVLVGIMLTAATLWIARGTTLVVGPSGIALRRPWGQTTIAWADVLSAGATRRGYVVTSRTGGMARASTKTLNLSPFLQNRANASLPTLVAVYLAGRSSEPGTADSVLGQAVADTARDPQFVASGIGARLGAWAIDVLTAVALWFIVGVAIDLFVGIPYGGRAPSSVGSAVVLIAIVVSVPAYAICCWHAGRTLGLWLFRLAVIDAKTGGRLSWKQCLARFVGALPSIVFVIPFGLFMAAGTDRLALHDRIAHSVVVTRGAARERTLSAAADAHAP